MADGVAVVIHLLHAPATVAGHVHAQAAAAGAGERHHLAVLFVELDGEVERFARGSLTYFHLRQHVRPSDRLFHIFKFCAKIARANGMRWDKKNRRRAVFYTVAIDGVACGDSQGVLLRIDWKRDTTVAFVLAV